MEVKEEHIRQIRTEQGRKKHGIKGGTERMRGRRIIAILISVLMAFTMLPMQTFAQGNVRYLSLESNYENGEQAHSIPINTYDHSYSLTAEEFTREGFILAGWATTSTGDISIKNGETFIVPEEGMTLYAIWADPVQQYTVTYDKNSVDATGTMAPQNVNGGGTCTLWGLLDNNPFRYRYHYLAGWALSPDGELKYRNGEEIIVIGNMNLYAVWRQSFLAETAPITDAANVDHYYINGISWRIIGRGEDKALLISDDLIQKNGQTTMTWADAKDLCSTVYTAFTDIEKTAVCSIDKGNDPAYYYYAGMDLDKANVFLLSASEADTYFAGNEDRKPGSWWLRSPRSDYGSSAGVVHGSGILSLSNVTDDHYGARPAFVLNLESVLFTSAAEGGKSSADAGSGFGEFQDGGTGAKKLTLLDSSRSGFAANVGGSSSVTVAPGDTVEISYSGVGTGTNEYVSAMLCNSDGDIIGYASVASDSDGADT